jgi:serine/threonine-protein kinase RsbW
MSSTAQLTLPASMAQWAHALAFVEEFCARHGVSRRDGLRLALVAEELFTNVVEHGHAGGAEAPVRIELGVAQGRLELTVEDRAAPFDPLAHARAQPPDLDGGAHERPVGGLGLYLVEQLAAEARYVRVEGCNRVWILLETETAPGSDPALE